MFIGMLIANLRCLPYMQMLFSQSKDQILSCRVKCSEIKPKRV